MKSSSAALVGPPPFRWGNWLSAPDPTGELATFLVSGLALFLLVVMGAVSALLPSSLWFDFGWGTFWLWLCGLIAAAWAAAHSVGTIHFRIDRVEINSSGMILMYSHIPEPLGNFEITTVHLAWDAIERIVEDDKDQGEGGHSYSIKVSLKEPLKTGTSELDLAMDGEQEMRCAFRKIQVLRS